MLCSRCHEEIPDDEVMDFHGQKMCEDCYIGAVQPPKTCDVMAVHAAKVSRKMAGHAGTDGLTELQAKIYEYIKGNEKVTQLQLLEEFNIPKWELEKQIATLRHCELVKGRKEKESIFFVTFDY